MSKLTAQSVDFGHGNYSTLIDKEKPKNQANFLKLPQIPQGRQDSQNTSRQSKQKIEKRMFAKVNASEDEGKAEDDSDEDDDGVPTTKPTNPLEEQLLGKKILKTKRLLNKSSFEIQDKERQCLQLSEKGNLWIVLALLAGICYAFNNFFLGQLSHHGFVAVIYVNIPSFFLFVAVYSVNFVRNKLIHGFYWSREISIFFKEEDNTIDWINVLGVALMSFCKFCGFCLVVKTFQFANAAGMNLGIITVIFNFCCITSSVVFYFVFKERLSQSQLLGTGVLLLSAIFIAQKPGKSDDTITHYGRYPNESDVDFFIRVQKTEKDHYYNAMLAIGLALSSTLFFSARDVILRYYKVNKGYPAFELSLDSLTLYSFGCVLYSFYIFCYKGYEFDWGSFSAGCMSAVLNTLGFMMLGISVVIGYAGPANALNSIQAVVLTFLSIMLMNQIPTSNQVTGMILGMLGTIIVSLGDTLFNAFSGCYREVRTLYNTKMHRNQDDSFTSGERFGGDYERLKN